jgi:serine/threonine protein kinase
VRRPARSPDWRRFLLVALAVYAAIWSLLEPAGAFGLSGLLQGLGLLGYSLLLVPSLTIAYVVSTPWHRRGAPHPAATDPAPAPSIAVGSTRLQGRYQLGERIADRPRSTLWEATDLVNQARVFVKLIKQPEEYDSRAIEAAREAYAGTGAQVSLPFASVREGQRLYEVMPYFAGWTLEEVLRENEGGVVGELFELWARELVRLVRPLHDHPAELVHRDVTPGNVLIRADTLDLVLLDFASLISLRSPGDAPVVVNPGFTPPEQAEGRPVKASDVYALGATLVFMNTGEPPPSPEERLFRRREPTLRSVRREETWEAVHRMLSLPVQERFADAGEAAVFMAKIRHGTEALMPQLGELRLPDGGRIVMHRHAWNRVGP